MSDAVGPSPPVVRTRTPRWVLVILVLSLLLNGIVAGAIFRGRWAFQAASPWLGSSVNAHLVGFAVTLPADRRREVWRATEGDREAMRPLRQAIRAAREEARAALLAEPFDIERFKAAQSRLLASEHAARQSAQRLIHEIAARLTPDERAAFARWEQRDGKRRSHFWRRMRGSDDDLRLDDPDASKSGKPDR